MGLYSSVETRRKCPGCGNEDTYEVQFRYGDVYLNRYQLGDLLKWNPKPGTNVGKPGRRKVQVSGFSLCHVCEGDLEFDILLENDRIVAVNPTDEFKYGDAPQEFIVIEE